jgi:hypothetical protein
MAPVRGEWCSSAKPVGRRFPRAASLFLMASCLLAAVMIGISRRAGDRSTEAVPQRPVANVTSAPTAEQTKDKPKPAVVAEAISKKTDSVEPAVPRFRYTRPSTRPNYAAQMDAARQMFEAQPRYNGYSQSGRSGPGWDEDAQYERHLARRHQFDGFRRMNQALPGMQPIPRSAMGLDR